MRPVKKKKSTKRRVITKKTTKPIRRHKTRKLQKIDRTKDRHTALRNGVRHVIPHAMTHNFPKKNAKVPKYTGPAETVAEFFARGGTVYSCPSADVSGRIHYTDEQMAKYQERYREAVIDNQIARRKLLEKAKFRPHKRITRNYTTLMLNLEQRLMSLPELPSSAL